MSRTPARPRGPRAYRSREPGSAAVSQPPFRPEAPKPANAASSTITRRPGWARARYQAVHNPV